MKAAPLRDAFRSVVKLRDATALHTFFDNHPDAKALVNEPLFPFDASALVQVAPWGDADFVAVLLAAGADPNRRSGWWAGGFHPLHRATGAVADRLIAAGAEIDACAAANLDRPDLLRVLLDADPSRVHERGGDGQTPLHFARSREVVDVLLERGADIDARDVDHRSSPAQWMLEQRNGAGRYTLAQYLVERGATADVFLAAALGLDDALAELLAAEPSRIALRTGHGEYGEQPPSSFHIYTWTIGQDVSPLRTAVQFGQHTCVALLQRYVIANDGVLAEELAAAAAHGDEALLRSLLDARPGAATLRMKTGSTPLHAAAYGGRLECCRVLLQHGADADARDQSDNAAPMHFAAEAGHAAVVELLADAGADIHGDGDEHLLGVLGWAVCFGREQRDVAELLMRRGARPHIFAAISLNRADVVRALIEADTAVLDARMNGGDMDLRTPLHHAVAEDNADMVELLLRAGADPNAGNRYGARPANYARRGGAGQHILELLMDHGAEPNDLLTLLMLRRFRDADALIRADPEQLDGHEDRPSPLHEAVSRQDGDAVQWLIRHGAKLDVMRTMEGGGVTPLHVAAANDAAEMAKLLIDAGADPTVRDPRWNADALGWAQYLGNDAARAVLEAASVER